MPICTICRWDGQREIHDPFLCYYKIVRCPYVCRTLSTSIGAPLSIARCGSPRLIGEKVANFILAATVTRKMLDAENVQNAWSLFARLIALCAVELNAR